MSTLKNIKKIRFTPLPKTNGKKTLTKKQMINLMENGGMTF